MIYFNKYNGNRNYRVSSLEHTMDKPINKIRQDYVDQIKVLEANLKDIASGEAPQSLEDHVQAKLDKLADRYQYDEHLGKIRYKLYELQALLYYYQNRDEDAKVFIEQAIETKGSTYQRAEQLLSQLQTIAPRSGISESNSSRQGKIPLELQSLIKSTRSSAIVMVVLSIISVYFIPWAVFYIYLASKLKSDEVPNRKLVKAAAIVTLPLCIGIVPIIIDAEFWRMNRRLKEYEERGDSAFKTDKQFLAGEPKRKKSKRRAWIALIVLISIFVILIVAAIATSSSSDTSDASNLQTGTNTVVQDAYQKMESLRSQYNSCSADLESRKNTVNTYSQYEVDSYNSDLVTCEATRQNLNNAVDEYNNLAGFKQD